jgi:hypothetical protein
MIVENVSLFSIWMFILFGFDLYVDLEIGVVLFTCNDLDITEHILLRLVKEKRSA